MPCKSASSVSDNGSICDNPTNLLLRRPAKPFSLYPKSLTSIETITLSYRTSKKPHLVSSPKLARSSLSSIAGSLVTAQNPTNPKLLQLCLTGDLEKAVKHFSSMVELKIHVEEKCLDALIMLCKKKRGYSEGKYVSEVVLSSPLSLRVGKALLHMFVRFADVGSAWNVFGRMRERDLVSWNIMVGAYAKAGFFDEALCLYHRMLWINIRPDVYTFPCVLRTCAGAKDLRRGREVHCHVIRFDFGAEVDVVNALMTMYLKCGDVSAALNLFDKMPRRDRISWNAMISGYFENDKCLEGLKLFFMMLELSIDPDLMTMTSVFSACKILGDNRLGTEILGYAIKTGYAVDVSVCNSLIQLYFSVGRWEEAEKVFSRMESRDVVSWTTMISGYEASMQPHKALETYECMELEGIALDAPAIATVLSSCACLGRLDTGMKLHELANRTGFISYAEVANSLIDMYSMCKRLDKALELFHSFPDKDVISWTSMIGGLRINNQCLEALIFFRQMQLYLKPNSVTLTVVLAACARIGALMRGKEVHAYALRSGVEFDGFLPNAILDMYARCGRMGLAYKQFQYTKKDVGARNILLTGHAQKRQGIAAVDLFNSMLKSKVMPDHITFISLLCACSRSGMVTEGLEYFNSMELKYHVTPNLKHYACVVDLLGRAGYLKDALEFIEKMPLKPDAAIWGALLNACRIHWQVALGELAAQHLFKEDTKSIGYYVLLCNFYAECDKWDELANVRRIMKEEGLIVDPGCSWVEAKGKLHAFLSSDNFHPQLEKINSILKGFYEKMKEAGLSGGECSSTDEASKTDLFCGHSERLAVAFGLINTAPGMPIWVTKNLHMCQRCHSTIKFISKIVRREISVRDTEQFHHFQDGVCSCCDEGYYEKKFDKNDWGNVKL